jgi:hypothetical protein
MFNIRCQNCSSLPKAECVEAHSVFLRREFVNKIGWIESKHKGLIVYFCSKNCQFKHSVKNKTHLKLVSVNRLTVVK